MTDRAFGQAHRLPEATTLDTRLAATAGCAARRIALSETDRQQLATIQADISLPPMLAELAVWMMQHGEKGEQEGYL